MDRLFIDLCLILIGSAFLSYVAVLLKQPIILAYIICGVILGPWGAGWVRETHSIEVISHLGITLLLFLAGLCLHPQKLIQVFRQALLVTFVNAAVSLAAAFWLASAFHFGPMDSLCIGLAVMFSSTILVVKLLPTTELHHMRIGATCIGILILQDLMAIGVLVFLRCFDSSEGMTANLILLTLKLIAFIGLLIIIEHFVLRSKNPTFFFMVSYWFSFKIKR